MAGAIIESERAGGRRRRRRTRPMAEINVTPFVDVMLVLLIIFMVAAPLSIPGIDVNTPKTAAGALPSEQEEPLAITLTDDGRVLLMTTEVRRSELIARLRAVMGERESDRIYLRADGALAWESVAQIMGAITAAGFTNIGMITDGGGPDFNGPDG